MIIKKKGQKAKNKDGFDKKVDFENYDTREETMLKQSNVGQSCYSVTT